LANFLTFVVDKICLLRNMSATNPLKAVKNHMHKNGAADSIPFYANA